MFLYRSSIDNVDKIINSYLTRLLCCKTTSKKSKVIVDNSQSPHSCSLFCPDLLLFFFLMHIFSFHISFCLIYLFFPSPWPSFLPIICSFSHCVDRKCGLCWVWAHQCGFYCPNLRELALKTKSRASEMVEGFTGWRGSKTGPDWVVYLFSVEKRGCQHRYVDQDSEERVCWGYLIGAELHMLHMCPIMFPSLIFLMAGVTWLDTVGVIASISPSPWQIYFLIWASLVLNS